MKYRAASQTYETLRAEMTRRPAKGAPPTRNPIQDANRGVVPCSVRLLRCCENQSNLDIAASATETVGHPLSKLTRPKRPAHRPSRKAGNTGSSTGTPGQPHKTPSWARGHLPGDARPERHQGRVAELTHDVRLASSGRRAPHSTASPVSFPSQDEWVGGRGINREEDVSLPICRRCKRISVLDPCRRCATAKEAAAYPDLPTSEETA